MEAQQLVRGRYRLLEPIGEGGMSVVWKAHDEVLLRTVAVKFLAASYASDAALRKSIRAEAQAVARLSHPNIANVFDYGESDEMDGSLPFVVMELLRGQSLLSRLSAGVLTPELATRVCAEIAGALAAAHAHDLVHRDVKPGNVMLTAAGAKVFDFGIAARVGDLDDVDLAKMVLGTPAYLAPERIQGAPVVPASDVYSLGVLLYRALTGGLPWPATSVDELMMAHLTVPPAPLPLLPDLPAEVGDLFERCLAKAPDDRPSAREAAVVLATAAGIRPPVGGEYGDGEGLPADEDERRTQVIRPAVAPSGPPASNRRAVANRALVALAVAAAAIGGGAAVWSASTDGAPAAQPLGAGATESPTQTLAGGVPSEDDSVPSPVPGAQTGAPVAAVPTAAGVPGSPQAPRVVGQTSVVITSTPPSSDTSFSAPGGAVTARCTGTQAYLVLWTPAAGYETHDLARGPDKDAKVTFRAGKDESRFTVSCQSGVPVADIETKP